MLRQMLSILVAASGARFEILGGLKLDVMSAGGLPQRTPRNQFAADCSDPGNGAARFR